MSNARCQPLPEAEAEGTLEAVSSTPWLGVPLHLPQGLWTTPYARATTTCVSMGTATPSSSL